MTEESLVKAVFVKAQKFGIADEQHILDLLPQALNEFAAAHVWDFLTIVGTPVSSVANRTYLNPPGDFWKIVALGRPTYDMEYITPQEYRRRVSRGTAGRVAGTSYTVEGRKIFLEPTPTSVVVYALDYYPFSPNLQLANIPDTYHPAVQKILEADIVPWEHEAFPVISGLAEVAVNRAIEIDNEQPAKTVRSYIEPVQALRNSYKYSRGRKRSSLIEEFGGSG